MLSTIKALRTMALARLAWTLTWIVVHLRPGADIDLDHGWRARLMDAVAWMSELPGVSNEIRHLYRSGMERQARRG